METETIRVFRAGKGTCCEWGSEEGQSLGRIFDEGAGVFLEKRFLSVADARAFCEEELHKDASLIFHIMRGDDITDTALNQAYQTAREKRDDRNYAVMSTTVVMLLALIISVWAMPFQTTVGHVLFIAGMTLVYVLLLSITGTGNFEGAVAMAVILILALVIAPHLPRQTQPTQGGDHTGIPAHRELPRLE